MDDVGILRKRLRSVQADATGLAWAKERPWRVSTHVFWQAEMPTVDGHDLNAKLMKRVLAEVLDVAPSLRTGAVLVVTGRGRHSLGAGSVLAQIVQGTLGRAAAEQGWHLTSWGPAAWVLVVDPAKAPRTATGGGGWGLWLLFVGFVAAAAAAVLHELGVI